MQNEEMTIAEIMEFLRDHMVTKQEFLQSQNKEKSDFLDAMDDKLAALKGDLIVLMRKEDKKLIELIHMLTRKDLLSIEEAQRLLSLEPFPQSIV